MERFSKFIIEMLFFTMHFLQIAYTEIEFFASFHKFLWIKIHETKSNQIGSVYILSFNKKSFAISTISSCCNEFEYLKLLYIALYQKCIFWTWLILTISHILGFLRQSPILWIHMCIKDNTHVHFIYHNGKNAPWGFGILWHTCNNYEGR